MSWSDHILLIGKARFHEARAFYRAETLRGGWSVRQLDRQIASEVGVLKRLQGKTAAAFNALLAAVLDRAFKGEL